MTQPEICNANSKYSLLSMKCPDGWWEVPVRSLAEIKKPSRDHAYILPDDSIWVLDYDGTAMILLNGGSGGSGQPTRITNNDGHITIQGNGTYNVSADLSKDLLKDIDGAVKDVALSDGRMTFKKNDDSETVIRLGEGLAVNGNELSVDVEDKNEPTEIKNTDGYIDVADSGTHDVTVNLNYDALKSDLNIYTEQEAVDTFYRKTQQIPANADLDDYKAESFYNCTLNATATTLLNCPTSYAFSLQVNQTTNNGWHQRLVTYNTDNFVIYERNAVNDVWGAWQKVTFKNETDQKQDKLTAGDHITITDNRISADLSSKQDVLVSGSNIKTINGQSILGTGDLLISGGFGSGEKTIIVNQLNPLEPGTFSKEIDDISINIYKSSRNEFLLSVTNNHTETATVAYHYSSFYTTSIQTGGNTSSLITLDPGATSDKLDIDNYGLGYGSAKLSVYEHYIHVYFNDSQKSNYYKVVSLLDKSMTDWHLLSYIETLEDSGTSGGGNGGSSNEEMTNHINDDSIHVTDADKTTWNNKQDALTLRGMNGINVKEISDDFYTFMLEQSTINTYSNEFLLTFRQLGYINLLRLDISKIMYVETGTGAMTFNRQVSSSSLYTPTEIVAKEFFIEVPAKNYTKQTKYENYTLTGYYELKKSTADEKYYLNLVIDGMYTFDFDIPSTSAARLMDANNLLSENSSSTDEFVFRQKTVFL